LKASIHSKIVNGKCATNKGSISKAFEQFEGKEITITIEKKKRKRSNEQNAYLWGCVYPLVKMQFYETCGEVFTIDMCMSSGTCTQFQISNKLSVPLLIHGVSSRFLFTNLIKNQIYGKCNLQKSTCN